MKIPSEAVKIIENEVQKVVDERIKYYPITVKIGGREVYVDDYKIEGGEILINLDYPVCYVNNWNY